jgi:hypothetical protein
MTSPVPLLTFAFKRMEGVEGATVTVVGFEVLYMI